MKLIKIMTLVLGLACVAMPAQARQAVGVHEKIVDGFVYLVDNSGSMMMEHEATGVRKIEMAKRIMKKIDSNVPDLGYQGALTLFAPNASVIPATDWSREVFADGINGISSHEAIYGRTTPIAESFAGASASIAGISGSKAVFLISDGMENLGGDPVAAARKLYAANPGMTMHVISLADSAKGQAVLEQIAALNSDSTFCDGSDFLDYDNAGQEIVKSALYEVTIPNQAVTSLHEVLFQVGRYDIQPKYAKNLDEMAAVLVTRPDLKLFVEGFADPSGSSDNNMVLSQNRANAVTQYLINAGVRADQFVTKGRGETDKYPSYLLDRRVEIMIIWQ